MAKEKTAEKSGAVMVRVLVDCEVGKCNTIAEIDAKNLPALEGKVDPHPDAVAYVESLGK